MQNIQNTPSGQLLQEYRDLMLTKPTDPLVDRYEEEISRRMSW